MGTWFNPPQMIIIALLKTVADGNNSCVCQPVMDNTLYYIHKMEYYIIIKTVELLVFIMHCANGSKWRVLTHTGDNYAKREYKECPEACSLWLWKLATHPTPLYLIIPGFLRQ